MVTRGLFPAMPLTISTRQHAIPQNEAPVVKPLPLQKSSNSCQASTTNMGHYAEKPLEIRHASTQQQNQDVAIKF